MATCESSGFAINFIVRGYHVYKDIRTSARGEDDGIISDKLPCSLGKVDLTCSFDFS